MAASSSSNAAKPAGAQIWTFHAFATTGGAQAAQWQFVDSLGVGGPLNPQFVRCTPQLDVNQAFSNVYPGRFMQVSNLGAQIAQVTIGNNP